MRAKPLATILLLTLLAGCATQPPAERPKWVARYSNACVPEAIAMAQGLRKEGIQAKVLVMRTASWGHAVTAYLYPPGANKLWTWDSYWGSARARAWWDDPISIARAYMRNTRNFEPLIGAEFIE